MQIELKVYKVMDQKPFSDTISVVSREDTVEEEERLGEIVILPFDGQFVYL